MSSKISLIIADDHPVFRRGLRAIVSNDPSIELLGEAEDGANALTLIREYQPDVAVLDIRMPKMDGIQVLEDLRKESVYTKVIFLTMFRDEEIFNKALEAGANGFLLKDNAVDQISRGIHQVAQGDYFISPELSQMLLKRTNHQEALQDDIPELASLTPTERTVLRLVGKNLTSKEIAKQLHISHRTVQNHRSNICEKLNLRGRNALLTFALEHRGEL